MTILIVFLTILLILDCLLLGLLIMVQLPKKEAGIGMAFGGGAADALFGAGSGTALSQLTKYTATAFFVIVFVLSVLQNHNRGSSANELRRQMERAPASAPVTTTPAPANNATTPTANTGVPLLINTNNLVTPSTPATTAPSTTTPTTNAPKKP